MIQLLQCKSQYSCYNVNHSTICTCAQIHPSVCTTCSFMQLHTAGNDGTVGPTIAAVCSCAALGDEMRQRGPTDTWRSLYILKHYCGYGGVLAFAGSRCNNCKL